MICSDNIANLKKYITAHEGSTFGIVVEDKIYILKNDIDVFFSDRSKLEVLDALEDVNSIGDVVDMLVVSDAVCNGDFEHMIDNCAKICAAGKSVELLVDIFNFANSRNVMRLFAGDSALSCGMGQTAKSVDEIMNRCGFIESSSMDVTVSEELGGYSYLVSENTLLSEYLTYAKDTLDSYGNIERVCRTYKYNSEVKEEVGNKCFLSILIRTQGKRVSELEEVLLSVYGQSDNDYEILLIGHNLDDEGKANVSLLMEDMYEELRKKIRFVEVNGGTRTTPLIKGFEIAQGEYVSILDDDDIVFDNWVEEFHKLAKENRGKILHAYCARQKWNKIKDRFGGFALRAEDTFEKIYCRDFDEIAQLSTNTCPIHSLAFPLSAYNILGMRFDESLNVVEDWDFLMRGSFFCGVANVQEITSIYRIWINAENSAALHSQEVWDETRQKIIDKFDSNPILLPKKSAGKIVDLIMKGPATTGNGDRESKLWTFFVLLDEKIGFQAENMVARYVALEDNGRFGLTFEDLNEFGPVIGIRLDPSEDGGIVVEDVEITLNYGNGEKKIVGKEDIRCNGLMFKGRYIFIDDDPQIYVDNITNTAVKSVSITGFVREKFDSLERHFIAETINKSTIAEKKKGLFGKKK